MLRSRDPAAPRRFRATTSGRPARGGPSPGIAVRVLVAVSAAAMVVAGCGSAGDAGGQAASPTAAAKAAGETSTLRVTTLYVCSEAHLAWGIEKGLFADRGIKIELVRTAGGAAGLAAIVAGEADLSSTNPVSAVLAHSQGFPIQIVSNSFNANAEGQGHSEGVVVPADSGVQGPEDLSGKKVAVNEIGSQNDVLTRAWIRDAGVDPMTVHMVALPFPQLVPAIEDGRVDAALVTGSQVAQLNASGEGRTIGNPLVDLIGSVSIAAYIATDDFTAANGDLVEAFVDGLSAAVEEVNNPDNVDEVLAVMSEYCGAPVPALEDVRFPAWNTHIDMEQLSRVADVMVDQGAVREPPDLEALVASTAL